MQGMRLMCRMHFTDRYDILEDQMLRNHMKLEKKINSIVLLWNYKATAAIALL